MLLDGSPGVDDSARAGALGVLGLRLLRHTLQGSKKQDGDGGDGGNALEEVGSSGTLRNGAMMAISLHVFQVVPAVVTCFSSRQDRLFVASAKCLGLLRGYFDSRPEVLGQYGATGPRAVDTGLVGLCDARSNLGQRVIHVSHCHICGNDYMCEIY